MQSEIMIEDRQSLMDLYTSLTDSIIPEFVQRLESIEFWIINSADLLSEMHKVGINAGLLSEIYIKTNTIYYKKLFISEMVSNIFTNIMRS